MSKAEEMRMVANKEVLESEYQEIMKMIETAASKGRYYIEIHKCCSPIVREKLKYEGFRIEDIIVNGDTQYIISWY